MFQSNLLSRHICSDYGGNNFSETSVIPDSTVTYPRRRAANFIVTAVII